MASQPTQNKPQEKKGFWDRLGLFSKVLIVLAVVGVIGVIFFFVAGVKSIWEFITLLIILGVFIGLVWLAIKGIMTYFQPRAFSPRDDNFTKLTEMAKFYKPDNLGDLFFVGDIGKKRVNGGRIVGCLGIPYLVAEFERDDSGNILMTEKKDPTNPAKKIPRLKHLTIGDDGDTLFIVQKGFINKKERYIRCNRQYHSTLNGDVEIFDINPYPHGRFEYPFKQVQTKIDQLTMQSQLETLLTSQEYQLDLISMGVDKALSFNPDYLMARKLATEQLQG